ncbi:helix-turn-helix transcriptional regulator [Mucilaginibacter sp. RS28]|uniref:Helix-turn-helix transcriptional regulator n=1 Tax=Mucilaginibacter straminoryzae TaxID=2932774 RepID=A0A9X1X2I1_9SPHI|nr:helix-turn-helix transcriptional regulator [Mucilaginibacter straminoryzae]MCJ8209813.1 helix-turn-helix transcriptional regulator [Mucilaginibacter straminoryzae]
MAEAETLEEFYKHKLNWLPDNLQKDLGHFNVFRTEDCVGPNSTPPKYSRRTFYKVGLGYGHYRYHYANKSVEVSGPTLTFFNPNVPYTYDWIGGEQRGFFCIFTEEFFTERLRNGLQDLPMFRPGGVPSYPLNTDQENVVISLYEKMIAEIRSDYIYKYDLIRSYLTELTHFALKTQPSETLYQHPDANSRITAVFTELLERQFPIEAPSQRFTLRSANDFAQQLSVHVNHLNRAVRLTTGKTTTERISERLLTEAKLLLRHTDWNISEIAYSLGFEEPTHFNNFFKKKTTLTPGSFRNV